MDKLASLWLFVRRRKYLITFVLFVVLVGFLDENSIVRRLGYYREETRFLRGVRHMRLICEKARFRRQFAQ